MDFIKSTLSMYAPSFPKTLVYMLQSTEYQAGPALRWFWRTKDFSKVMQRRQLDMTKPALALLAMLYAGILLHVSVVVWALMQWRQGQPGAFQLALSLYIIYPVLWAHIIVVPLLLGRWFIIKPKERKLIAASSSIFKNHSGTTIAVAGSYGKTSMKELLHTVLSQGLKVAATPANKNVPISHAYFARKLTGDEEVLIIEYGEGAPGDVRRFAKTTHPDIGIITGIAPAHLDHYKSLDQAAQDIFSLAEAVGNKRTYVNGESSSAKPYVKMGQKVYTRDGVDGWKITNVTIDYTGTKFQIQKGKRKLTLHTGLLGRHNVGPIAAVVDLAVELGMSDQQIIEGVASTLPFEHRMEPRVVGGAWIIDDTYNGNIEGLKAGIALLQELQAQRKIYVTPGLVDQGPETQHVHEALGRELAKANFDEVVLMQNSVTHFIVTGLSKGDKPYTGELRIVQDPLDYYTNLEHFVAAGDTVLMQNDWTDNYA